jgi:hypothetical protein
MNNVSYTVNCNDTVVCRFCVLFDLGTHLFSVQKADGSTSKGDQIRDNLECSLVCKKKESCLNHNPVVITTCQENCFAIPKQGQT